MMMEKAKQLVVDFFNEEVEKTDGFTLTVDDVYIVWWS